MSHAIHDVQFRIRLREDESAQLRAVAHAVGKTMSAVVRELVAAEHQRLRRNETHGRVKR